MTRYALPIALLLGVGLTSRAAFTATTPSPSTKAERELVIVSTASNRGEVDHCGCHQAEKGGLTRRVAFVDSLRRGQSLLVVDAGDYSDPTISSEERENWFILRTMNRMNYDAMTLGELELYRGADYVKALLDSTRVPVTLANVTFAANNKPVAEKFILKKVGGVTCGIIGLLGQDFGEGKQEFTKHGFAVSDPFAAARRIVPQVRKQADVVIVLAHLASTEISKFAKDVRGIDVIIPGHYPGTLPSSLVEGTLLIRSGQRGQFVGQTKIVLGDHRISSFSGSAVALDVKTIGQDPVVLANLRELMRSLGKKLRDDEKTTVQGVGPSTSMTEPATR